VGKPVRLSESSEDYVHSPYEENRDGDVATEKNEQDKKVDAAVDELKHRWKPGSRRAG